MELPLTRLGMLSDEDLRYAIAYAQFKTGDFEAAEESAIDIIPNGYAAIWIADENTASQWALRIINSLLRD